MTVMESADGAAVVVSASIAGYGVQYFVDDVPVDSLADALACFVEGGTTQSTVTARTPAGLVARLNGRNWEWRSSQ